MTRDELKALAIESLDGSLRLLDGVYSTLCEHRMGAAIGATTKPVR